VDTVISGGCHLELYSLRHVAKNRSNAVELAGANNQTGGGVQHHLQVTGDLSRDAVENGVTVVDPVRDKCSGQGASGFDCQ